MDKQGQGILVSRIKEHGLGYKFTVETFYPDGRVRRTVACNTGFDGRGLYVGGVKQLHDHDFRQLSLAGAYGRLVMLFDHHPYWLEDTLAMRRVTV